MITDIKSPIITFAQGTLSNVRRLECKLDEHYTLELTKNPNEAPNIKRFMKASTIAFIYDDIDTHVWWLVFGTGEDWIDNCPAVRLDRDNSIWKYLHEGATQIDIIQHEVNTILKSTTDLYSVTAATNTELQTIEEKYNKKMRTHELIMGFMSFIIMLLYFVWQFL